MKFTMDYSILGRIALGVGALSFLRFVEADVAQCVPGWEWSYNSKGENPCAVAGLLQAPCLGYLNYELGPLIPVTNDYLPPQSNETGEKGCGCNTIIYSLYSACTVCQRNTTIPTVTWALWSQFCDTVYITQYPFNIPFNTSVPHWAYLNYTDSAFSVTRAIAAGRDPEATPNSPSTASIPTISSSSSRAPPSTIVLSSPSFAPIPTTTTRTPTVASGGSKTAVCVVTGGAVGFAIFFGLTFF